MIIPISYRERFHGLPNPLGGLFAASTIGSPEYVQNIDYKLFKHSKDEKLEKKIVKSMHKRDLMKAYPDGVGKNLNIPLKKLSKNVINQF